MANFKETPAKVTLAVSVPRDLDQRVRHIAATLRVRPCVVVERCLDAALSGIEAGPTRVSAAAG